MGRAVVVSMTDGQTTDSSMDRVSVSSLCFASIQKLTSSRLYRAAGVRLCGSIGPS